jgi:SAM-dependent methyltransferase
MSFAVSDDLYDRLIGRYSSKIAPLFADFAGIEWGMRVLDVGAGPGALTKELARRVGAGDVAAADPSEPFVKVCAARNHEADVRLATAEELPWEDDSFDAALSQLAVNFIADADLGMREMSRVVRPGGVVAACTLDRDEGVEMLRVFSESARALDLVPPGDGPANRYRTPAELRELWQRAGLTEVTTAALVVEAGYEDFGDFWEGFLSGIGPDSAFCVSLDQKMQAVLREECRRRLDSPAGGFVLEARVWAVAGHVA